MNKERFGSNTRWIVKLLFLLATCIAIVGCSSYKETELSTLGISVDVPRQWNVDEDTGGVLMRSEQGIREPWTDRVQIGIEEIDCDELSIENTCSAGTLLEALKSEHLDNYPIWEVETEDPLGEDISQALGKNMLQYSGDTLYQYYEFEDGALSNPVCATAHWLNVVVPSKVSFDPKAVLTVVVKCQDRAFQIWTWASQPYAGDQRGVDVVVNIANSLRVID